MFSAGGNRGQTIPSGGYDRYGNLVTINVSKCSAPALSLTADTYNHVSGNTYDAAGEVTNDGLTSYTWDAVGRTTAAGSTAYTFDGNGRRVEKSSGTLYWYGAGGSVLAETDSSGNTTNEYIFFGGRVARRDGSGNVYYYFTDRLGSSRTVTNATGSICYDADFYPFGGELAFSNTCAQNYKFAGMERDPESGLDHTMLRQYTSNLGRWLSPNPVAGNAVNPQSLNRYAYALNNPTGPWPSPDLLAGRGTGPQPGPRVYANAINSPKGIVGSSQASRRQATRAEIHHAK
jgi:RHS repeat-associated protein